MIDTSFVFDYGDNWMMVGFPNPTQLLSLNKTSKMHWGTKAALVDAWRQMAWAKGVNAASALKRAGCDITMLHRRHSTAHVIFTVPDPGRRRDAHNFVATVKPVIDGLVDAGWLLDDSVKHLTVNDPRFVDTKPHRWAYITLEATP